MIESMLSVSTAHVPDSKAVFHDEKIASIPPRVVSHEYGWLVFVSRHVGCADWLKPIMQTAVERKCTVILFDSACDKVPSLKTYDW